MGKTTGFMEYSREGFQARSITQRICDYKEIYHKFPDEKLTRQAARCMDCGVPFCNYGCPLGNLIPNWNDLVYKNRWKDALEQLEATNNFPEFTGLLCPAPCEGSCVLGINDDPVTIKNIEFKIIDDAISKGWMTPRPALKKTKKKVAIVGSGPSGLACAQQLARVGHKITVFERSDKMGGLLRYGIPDFKMEKWRIDQRLQQMEAEGVVFKPNTHVGRNLSIKELKKKFDAIALCGGASLARDLQVRGRDLKGVYFAMEYLSSQNRINAGHKVKHQISAKGKKVVILGGGDTGADCLGTAIRQGASKVYQIELLPRPPEKRAVTNPWPEWPMIYRTASAHEEGGVREFSVLTKKFTGKNGVVNQLHAVRIEWAYSDDGRPLTFKEIPGSEFVLEVDLVFLALGFVGPEKKGMIENLKVRLDERGNVWTKKSKMTSLPGIFAAGDMRRGQSLIVWAINEGRECARGIDQYLMGETEL